MVKKISRLVIIAIFFAVSSCGLKTEPRPVTATGGAAPSLAVSDVDGSFQGDNLNIRFNWAAGENSQIDILRSYFPKNCVNCRFEYEHLATIHNSKLISSQGAKNYWSGFDIQTLDGNWRIRMDNAKVEDFPYLTLRFKDGKLEANRLVTISPRPNFSNPKLGKPKIVNDLAYLSWDYTEKNQSRPRLFDVENKVYFVIYSDSDPYPVYSVLAIAGAGYFKFNKNLKYYAQFEDSFNNTSTSSYIDLPASN